MCHRLPAPLVLGLNVTRIAMNSVSTDRKPRNAVEYLPRTNNSICRSITGIKEKTVSATPTLTNTKGVVWIFKCYTIGHNKQEKRDAD